MTDRAAYSAKELTEAYGIGMTKLYEEIKCGNLVARKLGTRTFFLIEDVERWVKTWPIVGIVVGRNKAQGLSNCNTTDNSINRRTLPPPTWLSGAFGGFRGLSFSSIKLTI